MQNRGAARHYFRTLRWIVSGMESYIDESHRERMKALAEFTAQSFATEHPSPFGSSIYDRRSGRQITQAFDTVIQECDPTNHAEVNAIRDATKKLQCLSLRGCILYSTCEPCPMCMSACIWAELDAVVFGASTLEDANGYWPQSSDVTPDELIERMLLGPKCDLVPHVERSLCQQLFVHCDDLRKQRKLQMPPNRDSQ